MNSAELAITRIQTLLEDWLQLPSTNAPISDFRNLKIDPSEFEKAGNVRKALDDFAAYLGATAELPRLEAKLASLPTALLDKLSNTIAEVHNILHRMRDVWKADPRSGVVPPRWTEQQFSSHVPSIQNAYAELYGILQPLHTVEPADVQQEVKELRELLVKSSLERQSAEGATEKLEERQKEAAVYVLAEINVKELDSVIQSHRVSSICWLCVLVLSSLLTFRLAWWVNIPDDKILWFYGPMFPQPHFPLTSPEVLLNAGRKLILLSTAFALPLLALRAYTINLHNMVVNRQRKIAVVAFTKLYTAIKDTADTATKVELVKQAAQTIFAQATTGFLSKQRSYPDVMELLRQLMLRQQK